VTPSEQIENLTRDVESLLRLVPTPEEHAYLQNKMREDANVAWLVRQVRIHAPWVILLASALGTAFYYFATHTINISGPK
jgi:hypothetical protein